MTGPLSFEMGSEPAGANCELITAASGSPASGSPQKQGLKIKIEDGSPEDSATSVTPSLIASPDTALESAVGPVGPGESLQSVTTTRWTPC